jgi:transglutaminase/protease-like cytokinesis protein 3
MGENYSRIDNEIYLYSKKGNRNFDSVLAFVTRNYSDQEERARAFYIWIALNINYDTEKIEDLEFQRVWNVKTHFRPTSQLADTVIKNGKAVCEGFSNLFIKFCKAVSIPCEMVVGYSKMENGEVITGILHAWNVIQINNEWYPVDITWSNGYVDNNRKYVKRFSTKYFMLPSHIYHQDHLPLDPMWQLSDNQ